jgi:hypothetical protein
MLVKVYMCLSGPVKAPLAADCLIKNIRALKGTNAPHGEVQVSWMLMLLMMPMLSMMMQVAVDKLKALSGHPCVCVFVCVFTCV